MRTTNNSQEARRWHPWARRFSQTGACRVAVAPVALKALLQQLVGDESATMPQGCLVQLVLQSLVLRGPVRVTVACMQLQLWEVVGTIAGHCQRSQQKIHWSWPMALQPLVQTRAKKCHGVP